MRRYIVYACMSYIYVCLSGLFLQWMQNDLSWRLAFSFAFSWHVQKFFLSTLVLFILFLFFVSLVGSKKGGLLIYSVVLFFTGLATHLKMVYRKEPLYPEDIKMIGQVKLLKEMMGGVVISLFYLFLCFLFIYSIGMIYKSLSFPMVKQLSRLFLFLISFSALFYIGQFNQKGNVLKKAYDQTALWIPYSQMMNYYNVGFVGGFLYNLNVPAMTKPKQYSEETIHTLAKMYVKKTKKKTIKEDKKPNIIYIMSESFSNPLALKGVSFNRNPLKKYDELKPYTSFGQMLSTGYGGGTANIEFEALTSFSMAFFNPQLTTPYTQLLSKVETFPSIVHFLKEQGYHTHALHPFNTSMYKRKQVYKRLGFDTFTSEKELNNAKKIQNNPYISDQSGYSFLLEKIKKSKQAGFYHFVTMQTHMPYENKYPKTTYRSVPQNQALENYAQDLEYATTALFSFMKDLQKVKRPTYVVFWGDHLPSIYDEHIKKQNQSLLFYLTEFFMYDTKQHHISHYQQKDILSPFYFTSELVKQAQLPQSPFHTFLQEMKKAIPAFEKNKIVIDRHVQKEYKMNESTKKLVQTYRLIQYDMTSGKHYLAKTSFFQPK